MQAKVNRLELSEELMNTFLIHDVYYTNKQIEISFTRQDGQNDAIVLDVLPYAHDTIQQLDSKVNGSMHPAQFTRLMYELNLKFPPIWDTIYVSETEQEQHDEVETEDEDDKEEERKSNAEDALEIANEIVKKLFVDEYQTPHASILVKDHLEVLPLNSRRFRNYLANQTYKQRHIVLDSRSLKDVIGILSAQAEFDSGEPIRLNLRVANAPEGKTWYYDMTNENWEFIEISANGWKVVKSQDTRLVLFHRYTNQLAQVYPSRDYDPKILDRFIELVLNRSNVKDEEKLSEYSILLKCYIICSFIPDIPKAILMPHGSQGAAKTTLMELVKSLIDPSVILTLSFPRDVNEFIQQLSHNHVAYYDNISNLRDWTSDQICRAVSGSGSSKRVLYSDDDDFIRTLMRCIGLNGINLAATKPDILDRSIFFELKRIDEKDRRYIKTVKKEFEDMRPQLLGYILDTLVKVMSWIEKNGMIKLDKLPRMADWAGYCEIISRCMGLEEEKFIKAYENNAKIQVEQVMETSLVASCIARLVESDEFNIRGIDGMPLGFEGTASELKKVLEEMAAQLGIDTKDREFPKKPARLTRTIREIQHTLKEAGIEVEFVKASDHKRTRLITIRKLSSEPSESSDSNKTRSDSSNSPDDTFPQVSL